MKRSIFSVIIITMFVNLGFTQDLNDGHITSNEASSKIIVYGSDTCHYCIDTKTYLKKHNVSFVYYDIDQNKAKELEMVTKLRKNNIPLNNLSLPVVEIKGKILMNKGDFNTFLKQLTAK